MAKPPTGLEEDKAPFERTDFPEAAPPDAPFTARPLEGEIDFRSLRAELSAQFPKTLAKLAE